MFDIKKDEAGFTLIEVLIVVVIIGFLATIVGPDLFGRVDDAQESTVKSQINIFELALNNYRLDNGYYPSSQQGLEALVNKPSTSPIPSEWNGPYLEQTDLPEDPWGNEYQYRKPGVNNEHSYDIWSEGPPDAKGGSTDNKIGNW